MNGNEQIVFQALQQRGFRVITRGWPDFLCVKHKWLPDQRTWDAREVIGAMAVEVKAGKDQLSADQEQVHSVLKAASIPVYVIRPEDAAKKRSFATTQFITSDHLLAMQHRLRALENECLALKQIVAEATALLEPSPVRGNLLDQEISI